MKIHGQMQMQTPIPTAQPLTPDTQAMLDSLQLAVTKTLERKRRLGHYVLQWSGGAPILVGEDAPASPQAESVSGQSKVRKSNS